MAKWAFTPKTVNNSITAQLDSSSDNPDSTWQVYQDEKPFIDEAKRNREEGTQKTHMNHKKFATIPDIVAIELLTKYGLDIHSPTFMHDPEGLKRLKYIIMTDYPHLVVNKA